MENIRNNMIDIGVVKLENKLKTTFEKASTKPKTAHFHSKKGNLVVHFATEHKPQNLYWFGIYLNDLAFLKGKGHYLFVCNQQVIHIPAETMTEFLKDSANSSENHENIKIEITNKRAYLWLSNTAIGRRAIILDKRYFLTTPV
mgnify:CR=1 FL=1